MRQVYIEDARVVEPEQEPSQAGTSPEVPATEPRRCLECDAPCYKDDPRFCLHCAVARRF